MARLSMSFELASFSTTGKLKTALGSAGIPPSQLASSDQLIDVPSPVHVWTAGASRSSSLSSSNGPNFWQRAPSLRLRKVAPNVECASLRHQVRNMGQLLSAK